MLVAATEALTAVLGAAYLLDGLLVLLVALGVLPPAEDGEQRAVGWFFAGILLPAGMSFFWEGEVFSLVTLSIRTVSALGLFGWWWTRRRRRG